MRWAIIAAAAAGCGLADEAAAPPQGIVLERIATVRGQRDSLDLSLLRPARSASGYVAVKAAGPGQASIALFDPDGQYLRRIGRVGAGPGEYQEVNALGFGNGDSLWVLDGMTLVHVFTPPPEPRYARTVRLESPAFGYFTPDGLLAAGAHIYTEEAIRHPQLFGFDGARRATYGEQAPRSDPFDRLGALARVDSTTIWVGNARGYVLERLNSAGGVERRVERKVDWFPAFDSSEPATQQARRPRVLAVSSDGDRRLWVLVLRTNPNWKGTETPLQRPAPASAMAGLAPTYALAERYEGVLEVLDPTSGRLMATRLVSGGFLGFVGPDVLCEVEQDDMGFVTMHFWRASVAESQRDLR